MHKRIKHSALRRHLLKGLIAAPYLATPHWVQAAQFPEISWEALIPPNWDPMKSFRDLQHLANAPDSDPRVQTLYDRMRKVWDEAPTVASLKGRRVKIPGFIVPLEGGGEKGLKEFLLVPYFGACIHTPPPPANQIIHVTSNPPVKGFQTMTAVWVSGTMELERGESEMGASGYRIQAARVEKYREK